MANRQQRRQGVVYGPVRPPGSGRSSGEILGRLLGLVVLVLAVGVLGVGALALLNERSAAQPTRLPTLAALATPTSVTPSPSPDAASPTIAPATATPVAETLPPASPTPMPEVTPFVPVVQEGPGFVTFGTRTDDRLRITDPQATFSENVRMRWSAHLLETANSDQLRVRTFKMDETSAGGERLIREDEVRPPDTEAQVFLRRVRPANALEGPGVYRVQFVRGDEVLAEGLFAIEG